MVRLSKGNSLYLSVLTFGEIEKGIEKASNQIRKQKLRLWVEDDLKKRFEGRIISIDFSIAEELFNPWENQNCDILREYSQTKLKPLINVLMTY